MDESMGVVLRTTFERVLFPQVRNVTGSEPHTKGDVEIVKQFDVFHYNGIGRPGEPVVCKRSIDTHRRRWRTQRARSRSVISILTKMRQRAVCERVGLR